MDGLTISLESFSLIISVLVIVVNFRTPVIVRGEQTLTFNKVSRVYWHNGMLIDVFGIVPFNLMLGATLESL